MEWEKLGLVFNVNENSSWMFSHAALPIPTRIKDSLYRIFFSTRDKRNRSHGAFIEIDLRRPQEVLRVSEHPCLAPGVPGLFDDCGVSLSCHEKDSGIFYYLGWTLLESVPYSAQIGAARSSTGNFEKISKVPLISKCDLEPSSFGYPWVSKSNGTYKMWYDSISSWGDSASGSFKLSLNYAESNDGLHWIKRHHNCIEVYDSEIGLSRPMVLHENGKYKMWYSINIQSKYRLGYAESTDGIAWQRLDDLVGIEPSVNGWDGEEIAYPCVFDHEGERYMFYNGNSYGRTGFGLARLAK